MSDSISLFFENGEKPSIILSKEPDGRISMHCMVPGFTGVFSQEEASLLASSLRILLGQEKVAESKEKVILA